jgi:hypothetical protein
MSTATDPQTTSSRQDVTSMTATTEIVPTTTAHSAFAGFSQPLPPIRKQGFGRLMSVEMRKMIDTRGGRWAIAAAIGLVVIALGWKVAKGDAATWEGFSAVLTIGGMLLPVIALLGVTSEWSQRTALTTFTLSPRRGRVLTAKILGSITLVAGIFAVTIGLTAIAVLLEATIRGTTADFSGFGGSLQALAIMTFLQVLMGIGIGALVGQTAVAAVAYFVLPTLVSGLAEALLGRNGDWINVFAAYDRLSSQHPWNSLGETVVSIVLWVGIPFAAGITRSMRREVK